PDAGTTAAPDMVPPADAGSAPGTESEVSGGPDAVRPADAAPGDAPAPAAVSSSAATAGAALELRGIHAAYGEVEVLHGVDLVVPAGGAVAVVGANGAGKSTMCAVIGGTLAATAGTVSLAGADVTGEPAHLRARAGLLLAPEARGIFPGLTVDDNLRIRLRTDAARRAARERFPILGERGDQLAELLSGGEQQQLAMAVALADPPAVFVADEPSLGLAPMAAATVNEALAELREAGTALVLVEEQAGAAIELADEVVVLALGRVAWRGPADEVDLDALTATYLGASV
ncbi:MAG: ATP-binding cassette domain-containing protein, partial [Acidimicrobiales bacterium]|nr:ATP-binding cassette domain-containing protein [Acidimicrobiales bacterium]